jgi:AraC family transcriptional regulator, regulatory protein of adaptative response / methylated-DNA-[protein]-cysteine methyltransferase
MKTQDQINYYRIAEAINYIQTNFKNQPDLDEVAEKVNLSPYHFQRLFSDWAGVSPKKFLQHLSVEHAKQILKGNGATLFDAAFETGLSGTGRLHDLFINIEGMTPGEYANDGKNLTVKFSFADSPFGNLIVASTTKGICHMAFCDEEETAISDLIKIFPQANYLPGTDLHQQHAIQIFNKDWSNPEKIKLHLKGTEFQLNVWRALLKIPEGIVMSYGALAHELKKPNASRAVGTAIGSNPVAYLIPCHRVIQGNGKTGGYMWGTLRKSLILGWESVKKDKQMVPETHFNK